MSIRYFGPFDGHDVQNIARVMKDIKDMEGPKILHLHTVKGKGFEPAEKAATVWHAPGIFDKETGERIVTNTKGMPPLFQEVFGHTVLELAKQNDKIIGITPAMTTGCSMNIMMKEMPDRAFDVGIAEGHAVTFSGGMAKDGLLPFCNIYSTFMQRALDNVIHDVAIQNLNVVLCLDRAGLVGEDGPTHHGAFDMAYLRCIPNLTIASPYNEHELRQLMYTAQLPDKGPFVIRYPRGRGSLVDWRCPLEEIPVGTGRKLKDGKDMAVITIGPIGTVTAKAIARAEAEGATIAHYDLRFLKPLDQNMLHEIGQHFNKVVTVEDGVTEGGMGSCILEFMSDNNYSPQVKRIGIPNIFVEHGSVKELYKLCGMDEESIYHTLKSQL
jgi:Deoxyxylulose-5-phosphate synthase